MIRLTAHAAEAMSLRAIDLAWVEAALTEPDARRADDRRAGVTLSFKSIAAYCGRVLRVAHRMDGADTLVITVHFDRGARL